MTTRPTAYDITNVMIRETGEAMQTGDFDLFMRHFTVPFILETFVGKELLQSRHAMRLHFEGGCRFRAENGIVESVRENISATFVNDSTISLTHVSQLFQEGGVVFDRPYPAHSIIRNVDGRWLTHYCHYAVGEKDAFTRALLKYQEKTPREDAALSTSSVERLRNPDLRTFS